MIAKKWQKKRKKEEEAEFLQEQLAGGSYCGTHLSHLCAFLWHSRWQLTRFFFFGFYQTLVRSTAMRLPQIALHFHYVLLFAQALHKMAA